LTSKGEIRTLIVKEVGSEIKELLELRGTKVEFVNSSFEDEAFLRLPPIEVCFKQKL
jgi:hypothetical protein